MAERRQKAKQPAAEGDSLVYDLLTEIEELRAALAERKARLEACDRYREALERLLEAEPRDLSPGHDWQAARVNARQALDG